MFRAATEWALEERLPVVYLAANSGARVGLANEVKQCLRVRPARTRPAVAPAHAPPGRPRPSAFHPPLFLGFHPRCPRNRA